MIFSEASMATALDPKQIVSFVELFMSRVIQQEALSKLKGSSARGSS
jgi:hypothetical protein